MKSQVEHRTTFGTNANAKRGEFAIILIQSSSSITAITDTKEGTELPRLKNVSFNRLHGKFCGENLYRTFSCLLGKKDQNDY